MRVLHVFFLSLIVILFNCTQPEKRDKSLTIDYSIRSKVVKYVTKYTDTLQPDTDSFVYSNKYMVEVFFNDMSIGSTYKNPRIEPFKSDYFWVEDTLIIRGDYGFTGNLGFEINIYRDTAIVFGTVKNNVSYRNNINDTISPFLIIPSTESKVILSEFPDKENKESLYGYLEFKQSNVYFQQESEKRMVRQNMKAYFKSVRSKQ